MILPTPAPGFEWRTMAGRTALVCTPLATVARHVFTTADWPTGARGTAFADPADPWRPVAEAVGVAVSELTRLHQVHGTAIALASGSRTGDPLPDADVVLVDRVGLAGAIQVADCVPMLVGDVRHQVVAAAHAGWRGLAAGVPRRTIQALRDRFGSDPGDLIVACGPSIGACCYEVGQEVREAFSQAGADAVTLGRWFRTEPASFAGNATMPRVRDAERKPAHWFFDGWACVRDQLEQAGVPGARVFLAGLCTASHPALFCSYRRDGAPAGRLAAAIRAGTPR